MPRTKGLSRRDFMKVAAAALAAVGLPAASQALAAPFTGGTRGRHWQGQTTTLKMQWWGEQEAPGLEAYVKKSIDAFKARTGVDIETTLSSTDGVISDFQTASAANNAPDLQFFWNGIYHMESVWLGYIEPLNGLIPDDILKASNATVLSIYEGKQYRVGWYSAPLMWAYNKEMFSQAGLDADNPPKTWAELLAGCDKLKSKGFQPIVGGLKDGYWGEWFMGQTLTQSLDTPADALNLFIGEKDWRDPKHYAPWTKLEELWKGKYLNDDLNSIELYPGIDLLGAGKGAITAIVGPLASKLQQALGSEDKVGVMVVPIFGEGKMAGRPIYDTQGLGISSQSKNKAQAAEFLKFMMEQEQLQRLYDEVGQIPANAGWDASGVKNPAIARIARDWMQAENRVPYIANLMPVLFWTDAMFVNAQKVVSGEYTPEQAGQNAYEVANKWREQNPDLLEKYTTWAKDLANI